MGAHYEMLRPVTRDDLERAGRGIAAELEGLPREGGVDADRLGGGPQAPRAIRWACSNGIMRRASLGGPVLRLETVRFWMTQLNQPKARNIRAVGGTRHTYAESLGAFSAWLAGKGFPLLQGAVHRERAFADVEELLRFCENPRNGARAARRVVRQYLADLAASGCAHSTAVVRCSAIKSYFAAHDVALDVRVRRGRGGGEAPERPEMSLFDLYRIMTVGRMGVMERAITMIKFQAGLDSSTLADRFNFEAWGQIAKHFGTEEHESWDLGRCPVPVRLARVKTGTRYTTFVDRDAVSQLQEYLAWREPRAGRYGGSGPLFVTRSGAPVRPCWIAHRFSKAAAAAGVQRRISPRAYNVSAHEVRDLLKSTLIVSGCAQYVADHVLGHAPRDSYEKQATLYPEKLRSEYAKASDRLNLFTSVERHLRMQGEGAGGEPDAQAQQRETQATLQRLNDTVTDMLRIMLLKSGGEPDARGGAGRPEGGGRGGA